MSADKIRNKADIALLILSALEQNNIISREQDDTREIEVGTVRVIIQALKEVEKRKLVSGNDENFVAKLSGKYHHYEDLL